MQQIVLTQAQVDFLTEFKKPFQPLLDERHIDFIPIEIKPDSAGNKQYILPVDLFNDSGYDEIKTALGDHLNNMVIREVLESELIEPTLPTSN